MARLLTALTLSLALAGCYDPTYGATEYYCSDTDDRCPEWLTCIEGKCVNLDRGVDPPREAGGDSGPPDRGADSAQGKDLTPPPDKGADSGDLKPPPDKAVDSGDLKPPSPDAGPPITGLIAWYKMDACAVSLHDASGNKNHAAVTGKITAATGRLDGSCAFGGGHATAKHSASLALGSSSFTVEAWIDFASGKYPIISKVVSKVGFDVQVANGQLTWRINDGTTSMASSTPAPKPAAGTTSPWWWTGRGDDSTATSMACWWPWPARTSPRSAR